jgi:outer membrane lipoprotein-sorting protein
MKRFAAALALLAVLLFTAACSGNEEDIIGNPDGTLGEEGFQKLFADYLAAPGVHFMAESYSDGVAQPATENWVKGGLGKSVLYLAEPDTQIVMYMEKNSPDIIQYDPQAHAALVLPQNGESSDGTSQFPLAFLDAATLASYTVEPNALVDGKACTILRHSDEYEDVVIYVAEDNDFPFRMDITAANGSKTIRYRNVSYLEISDAIFQLPEGVPLLDFH